jgi:hypothetical protein
MPEACLLAGLLRKYFVLIGLLLMLSACSQTRPDGAAPQSGNFRLRSVAKSDINQIMEIYVHEVREQLQSLMEKLYKRNPRELAKSPYPTSGENINRIFSRSSNWHFRELDGVQGGAAIALAFSSDYEGDRVFCLVMGLTSMIMAAYQNKTEYYLYDNPDPQGFYNSARNIELAVWKLGNARDAQGELFLYSNSLPDETSNLSYERLFGKMIVLQDTMAVILAEKHNRTISNVMQRMATAVFLPIP